MRGVVRACGCLLLLGLFLPTLGEASVRGKAYLVTNRSFANETSQQTYRFNADQVLVVDGAPTPGTWSELDLFLLSFVQGRATTTIPGVPLEVTTEIYAIQFGRTLGFGIGFGRFGESVVPGFTFSGTEIPQRVRR